MTKEEILKAVKERDTYVTLSTYIDGVSLFSTVEFTENEWKSKIDNKKAIEFLESLIPKKPNDSVKFDINLGFIVNSKVRKDKNRTIDNITLKDILNDVATVTISCFDDKQVYRKKSFAVDLNTFIERLNQNNWHLRFSNKSGLYMYPQKKVDIDLNLLKFSTLQTYRFDHINKVNGQKRSLESFTKLFYHDSLVPIDIFKSDTQTTITEFEKLISTSIEEKNDVYQSSTIYKVLNVLKMLGIEVDSLTPESIKTCISQLFKIKYEYTTQRQLELMLPTLIENFHEDDPAEPELYYLAKLFYTLTADLEEIISKKHIPTNFQNSITLFQNELSKQNEKLPNNHHVMATNSFNTLFLIPYIDFLSSHFEIEKVIKDILNYSENMEDICEYLISYLKNILIFLNEIEENSSLDNVFLHLTSHLVFSINQSLQKNKSSIELH